jgi:glyoxylase-like metal-dependent hydrolase (beta-lactamase superfamily II)
MWKITALDTGTIEMEKSIGTFLTNCGEKMNVPIVVYIIEAIDGEEKIIVDTGLESPERSFSILQQKYFRKEDQKLENIFKHMNIDPSEVGTVILTHLHHDHCGNNNFFPNARFIVQREELGYAFVPLPDEEKPYFSPLMGETPSFLGTPFELIDGDVELFNGISVLLTPGHTPGSQSILISTTEGTYCLAGDNVFFYENIEKNIPVGHIYSRADWFTSMNRIKRLADYILPSHDPRIFDKKPAIFP